MGHSRAFGIEIEAGFDLPGLAPVAGPAHGPVTHVALAELDELWDAEGATRVEEERLGGSEAVRWIDHRPGLGYRFHAEGFGDAVVSEAGTEVWCAPPQLEPWSWQRFLVGRVLPWAAVLQGREVFHAGAVVVGDAAIAFVGATGAGKTSLAARALLAGARFVTDDVLALERAGDAVLAHPGAGLLCMRPAELDTLGPGEVERLGRVLGVSGKTYLEVEREEVPRRLAGVFFLVAGEGAPRTEPLAPDPRLLLGSTFNESLVGPERLRRHLDLCADIADHVPAWRLHVGAWGEAGAAARLAMERAQELAAT